MKIALFDLDGTIVDTESIIYGATKKVFERYGKSLPEDAKTFMNGKEPLDIYRHYVQTLCIQETPKKLYDAVQEIVTQNAHSIENAALMPGVLRLLQHFRRHQIRMALVTGTHGEYIPMKLKGHPYVLDFFEQWVGGDEVEKGKPSPESFLKAASKMNVEPTECIVFEDSVTGVKAGLAAGMEVVLVPSVPEGKNLKLEDGRRLEVLPSLMDFDPTKYGFPPFSDLIQNVIKMNPLIFLSGTVVKGFGRGARELGIRTANIDDASLSDVLSTAVTGIYAGWASIGDSDVVYKMVMSIGWNPFYKNEKKTAEAWVLHEFPEDFYDKQLRLLVVGYLRPEADFTTLENLKAQIHQDATVARRFLEDNSVSPLERDFRLRPQTSTLELS